MTLHIQFKSIYTAKNFYLIKFIHRLTLRIVKFEKETQVHQPVIFPLSSLNRWSVYPILLIVRWEFD